LEGETVSKLSTHFDLSEFIVSQTAARLGLDNTPPPDVLENLKRVAQWLEGVRILLGVPILISSGYRSPEVNKAVGGAKSSQHLTGNAVDFTAPAFGSPRHVIDRIIDAGMIYDQLILEYPPNGWVHVSVIEHGGRQQALLIDSNGTTPLYA
jgi:zinc D-Ala-D-Ala carboxypeptidase